MNGSSDFSSKDDADLIAQAHREQIAVDAAEAAASGAEPPAAPPPAAEAPPPGAPAPAATPAAPTPPTPPAPAPVEEPKGNVNAALRASRHAEKTARQRLEAAEAENERLRKLVPAAPAVDDLPMLPDKLKADLEGFAPEALTAIEARDKALVDANAEIERLRKSATPAPAVDEEFVPEPLKDDLQEIVDAIPELSDWQNTKALQGAWEAVKAADVFLFKSGSFKSKPLADRLNAAVAMVKRDSPHLVASAPAVDPNAAARAVIDALPITQNAPRAGDLRSGESARNELPDYHQMAKQGMSDEEIMARLPR